MKLANEQQLNIVNDLIVRSTNDSKFKEQLIKDPKGFIEASYQFKVYDDVKLVVEDQSNENTIYLNIPRVPNFDEIELTEDELEKVAGGVTTSPVCVGILISAAGCALYDFGCGVVDAFR